MAALCCKAGAQCGTALLPCSRELLLALSQRLALHRTQRTAGHWLPAKQGRHAVPRSWPGMEWLQLTKQQRARSSSTRHCLVGQVLNKFFLTRSGPCLQRGRPGPPPSTLPPAAPAPPPRTCRQRPAPRTPAGRREAQRHRLSIKHQASSSKQQSMMPFSTGHRTGRGKKKGPSRLRPRRNERPAAVLSGRDEGGVLHLCTGPHSCGQEARRAGQGWAGQGWARRCGRWEARAERRTSYLAAACLQRSPARWNSAAACGE